LEYLLASRRGLRRVLAFVISIRIARYRRREHQRMAADARHLGNFERRVFSQNGEDGVIEEIFRRIGTANRFFVELGCGGGIENNTRGLLEYRGWSGVWIDGDSAKVENAQRLHCGRAVKIRNEFIRRDNIVDILEQEQVPREPDLLVVDIDGNDY